MKNSKFNNLRAIIPVLYCTKFCNEESLILLQGNLIFSLFCLKNHINYQYKVLSCITGIDLVSLKYRFGIFYDLLSIIYNSRIRIKIYINEITSVDSCISIYSSANWWEREIWDFFGIYFNKHPDMRRLLTDYGFEGHPMRKDFPLSGYFEVRYDQSKKRVVVEPLELSQEFRKFTFEIPW